MTQNTPLTRNLLLNREYERVWQRHCGFLDLTLAESVAVQRRLLEEQFEIARKSKLWQTMFPAQVQELTLDNFRQIIPLTTYADYEPHLAGRPDDILGRPIQEWARTSGRGGRVKWIPYTPEAYLQLGEVSLADAILASAAFRGDVRVRQDDVVVTNLPARPYLSGLAQVATAEYVRFRLIPRLDEFEQMTYQERNAKIFERAMVQGMDLLGSMTLVLVKMGEYFESDASRQRKFTWQALNPRLLWRYIRARARARKEGRDHVLPRDLWQLKGLMCGGADTEIFRERIRNYWGRDPHESYGCTEAGILAVQAWDCGDMTFIPHSAFMEFIPTQDWAAERLQGAIPTRTLLIDELEVGSRYEVVISNFYGGPLLRYRLHDLIEVTAAGNEALDIHLPQIRFVGRSGDFIDLSGFAGLIDEKQLLTTLRDGNIPHSDWVIRKEILTNESILHLYIELTPETDLGADEVKNRFHTTLKGLNPEYANIEEMLGYIPVKVTILPMGTFSRYLAEQTEKGADMAHLKPNRINPSREIVDRLVHSL